MAETSESPEMDDLQFSTAEPMPAATVPSAAPAAVAAPMCAGCKQPIGQTYYAVGDKLVCTRCQQQLTGGAAGGSKYGRLAKATALGLGGAIVGTLIWYAVRRVTGYEIGLIAVVVGLIVGGAVRAGSGGRGGPGYQVLAILLTYFASSANYMPDLIQGFIHKYNEDKVAMHSVPGAATRHQTTGAGGVGITKVPDSTGSDTTAQPAKRPPSLGRAIVVVGILIGLALVLMLIVPVLIGIHNPIGLLIMAFALYEAWKINARRRLPISGPYSLGATGPAVLPVGMPR